MFNGPLARISPYGGRRGGEDVGRNVFGIELVVRVVREDVHNSAIKNSDKDQKNILFSRW